MELPPAVRPVPLQSTTPTGAEVLRSCSLQAAFDASPPHRRLVLRGPGARLGSVCHQMLEATARGAFDRVAPAALSDAFDQLWQQYIEHEELAVQQSPLERHFAQAERWPYYALKRAYTLRLVEQIVAARQSNPVAPPGAGTGAGRPPATAQRSERQYAGFDGRLRGRADHVKECEGRIQIVDYKTGAIYGEADGSEPVVRPEYRRQLLLYAALHWDETGVWPTTATLESLRGEGASISVEPQEAHALVEETLDRLRAYNDAVRSGRPPEALASPSAQVCSLCPYKSLCPAFWKAAGAPWADGRTAHISGALLAIEDHQINGWVLEIDGKSGTLPAGRYRLRGVTARRFPDRDGLPHGSVVCVINARVVDPVEPRDLVPTDYTEIWWEAEEAAGAASG